MRFAGHKIKNNRATCTSTRRFQGIIVSNIQGQAVQVQVQVLTTDTSPAQRQYKRARQKANSYQYQSPASPVSSPMKPLSYG
jgi:hypothetical protein